LLVVTLHKRVLILHTRESKMKKKKLHIEYW